MNISVLTPEKSLFQGEVVQVKVPGTGGLFEILKGHAAIVSSLVEGTVSITTRDGEKKSFEIKKGFVEVFNDEVSVLIQS